ncbi:MAG TPA: PDZ domain-containing protein [Pirellulales bacterium]|jgi:hypothetical protein|nr:PDZ domain-containing protein [Pirellulales bacterium]
MKLTFTTLAAALFALASSVALADDQAKAPANAKPMATPTVAPATPATKAPTNQPKDAGSPAANDIQGRMNAPGPAQPAQPNVLPSPNNPLQQQNATNQFRAAPQTTTAPRPNQAAPLPTAQPSTAGQPLNSGAINRDNRAALPENRNVQNDNRATQIQNGRTGRTAMRPTDLRAPDIGLWFDRHARNGLVISDIATTGAITRLGFREGDRIVSINGRRVTTEPEFLDFLLGNVFVPGEGLIMNNPSVVVTPVDVVIMRDGQEQTILVDPSAVLADYGVAAPLDPLEQFGVVLDDRINDQAVVWKVLPRTAAYYAGLRAGDVLTTFHDRPIRNREDFAKSIASADPGEASIQVRRGERNRDLQVDMPRFDQAAEQHTAMRPNLDTGASDQSTKPSDQTRSDRSNRGVRTNR